jgi:hypothetical protein
MAHNRGQTQIADCYGNGYLLEVLSKALKKALGIVDDSGPINTREKEEHGSLA